MKKLIANNKVYIITFIIFTFFTFFWYLVSNGLFHVVGTYLFNPEQWAENMKLSDDPIICKDIFDLIRQVLGWSQFYYFDDNMIFSFTFYLISAPLFASIVGVVFYKEYNNMLIYEIYRKNNLTLQIIKRITKNAIKMALALFAGYLVFYFFMMSISNGSFAADPKDLTSAMYKYFLSDILTEHFYRNHIYLYFFIDGLFKIVVAIFSLSVFAQSFALIINNKKSVITAPLIYFYGLIMCTNFLIGKIEQYYYFSPTIIIANADYYDFNSYLIILNGLVPMIIGFIIIFYKTRKPELL